MSGPRSVPVETTGANPNVLLVAGILLAGRHETMQRQKEAETAVGTGRISAAQPYRSIRQIRGPLEVGREVLRAVLVRRLQTVGRQKAQALEEVRRSLATGPTAQGRIIGQTHDRHGKAEGLPDIAEGVGTTTTVETNQADARR